jgi:hypothetical protein
LSYPSFERATEVVNQFINLLAEHGVDLRQGSAAEGDALAMIDVLDMWKNPTRRPTDPRPVAGDNGVRRLGRQSGRGQR